MSSRFVQDIKEKVGGSDKDNDSLNFDSESKTGSAATHATSTHEISNKDITVITTENDLMNNGEGSEGSFGTLNNITQSTTSSDDMNNTDEMVEFIEDVAEDEGKIEE